MKHLKNASIAIRTTVMGADFVNRAMGEATDFSLPLQEFVNEHAWGSVWARESLTLQTRSLITLSILTAPTAKASTCCWIWLAAKA